jgi:hypothetical protein
LELAPDGVADATLQSAQRLLLGLSLGDLALVVDAARGVVADLGDRGQVEGVVELAVTARSWQGAAVAERRVGGTRCDAQSARYGWPLPIGSSAKNDGARDRQICRGVCCPQSAHR